jgi:hypothetical protein
MRARYLTSRAASLALAAACLFAAHGAVAQQFYLYEESDGTRWLTDRRMGDPDYRYIGRVGRPTATHSCHGVTYSIMEKRAESFLPTVRNYATRYEVDELLVKAIITVESCFDTHAVSRAGAKGLMQLMPQTAVEVGVRNVFNPHENIRGGVRYFRAMLERFEHDVELALAAYNAGPSAVERFGGIPPYRETQRYVERVLANYERYGGKTERADTSAVP